MPTTAFSKNYGKEYEVEQLLRVMGCDPDAEIDTTLRDLPPDWRNLSRRTLNARLASPPEQS